MKPCECSARSRSSFPADSPIDQYGTYILDLTRRPASLPNCLTCEFSTVSSDFRLATDHGDSPDLLPDSDPSSSDDLQ